MLETELGATHKLLPPLFRHQRRAPSDAACSRVAEAPPQGA